MKPKHNQLNFFKYLMFRKLNDAFVDVVQKKINRGMRFSTMVMEEHVIILINTMVRDQFLGDIGIEGMFTSINKTNQFIGIDKLLTFSSNDIFKNPGMANDFEKYRAHLNHTFIPAMGKVRKWKHCSNYPYQL